MNTRPTTVSVIIPTHNRAHLLDRAVKSALEQTYPDFELIIVDDASTDNTVDVVKTFKDDRIRYVRQKENRGGPAARNTGIQIAKGIYIALLDDDDEWAPTKLEKQVARFMEVSKRVGFIYSGYKVGAKKGNVIQTTFPEFRGNLHMKLLVRNMISGSSIPLVKKECFEKVGVFDEKLKSCQDWDMWLRISKHYEFDFVPEILATIHFHRDQISSDYSSMIPGRARMVEKHSEEFREHPEILIIHLKRMGKLHLLNGTWREAIPWFKKALNINPVEIIKILAWFAIEFPRIRIFARDREFKRYHKD